MAKSSGWAKQAGNQGAAVVRRTPTTRTPDARRPISGRRPAGPAAAVGLVSPPGGIVLWDEWSATLKKQGDGENPEVPGDSKIPAKKVWLQHAKEVKGDQKKT
jgi:hypothetical protein